MNDTKRPALSRTWQTVTTYRECGVVVSIDRDTVTLSRDGIGGKLSAQVNGEGCEVARADRLLRTADTVTLTAEVLAPDTIGKARAARLHKIMGRVGLSNPDHYGNATRAVGREVFSLATLTEEEARRFWHYLCRTFPTVRTAV